MEDGAVSLQAVDHKKRSHNTLGPCTRDADTEYHMSSYDICTQSCADPLRLHQVGPDSISLSILGTAPAPRLPQARLRDFGQGLVTVDRANIAIEMDLE